MSRSFLRFVVVDKATLEERIYECDARGLPRQKRMQRRKKQEMIQAIENNYKAVEDNIEVIEPTTELDPAKPAESMFSDNFMDHFFASLAAETVSEFDNFFENVNTDKLIHHT